MRKSESWQTWAIILGILVVSGLISAAWPWFRSQVGGSQIEIAHESEDITINIPPLPDLIPGAAGINDRLPDRLGPWHPLLAVAILTGLVLAPIVLTGGLIAGLYTMLDKQANAVKSTADYTAAQAELKKRDAALIKELRIDHPAPVRPKVVGTPRWSVIATIILIFTFVYLFTYMIAATVTTTPEWDVNGRLFDPVSITSTIVAVMATAAAILYFRRQETGAIDSGRTDYNPVPWNWVWVILSGMLVLGLGLGLIIVFSGPPIAG